MKTFTAAMLSAIAADNIRAGFMFYADLPTADWYGWTGTFDFTYDSQTWEAVGDLVSVSSYEESKDSGARGISVTMNYVNASRLTDVFSGAYHGRDAIVYLALFDANWSIIADPYVWFSGKMDKDNIKIGSKNFKLSMSLEHRVNDLLRNRTWRYTPEDNAALNTGTDTAWAYAQELQDAQFSWGK